ncbi:hypothetical protein D3C78_202390 [compost metagenome]
MKIISKCLLGVFCFTYFNMALYAQNISIQQAEQAINQKYAALDFYAVNQQIENDVIDLIRENAKVMLILSPN